MTEIKKSNTVLFENSCDEMLKSKFVMVDKKIGEILTSIASSNDVYNLIAECVVGFNFDREYKMSISSSGKFVLPEQPSRIVSFVFLLLSNFDDKKINIIKLLENNFACEGQDSYQLFLKKVILPFKESVLSLLSGDENIEEIHQVKEVLTVELAKRIDYLLTNIEKKIIEDKKLNKSEKLDAKIVVSILSKQLKQRNSDAVVGLFMGLKYIVGKSKKIVLDEVSNLIDLIK